MPITVLSLYQGAMLMRFVRSSVTEEIQAGKNRLMKSVYAQQLCFYLEE